MRYHDARSRMSKLERAGPADPADPVRGFWSLWLDTGAWRLEPDRPSTPEDRARYDAVWDHTCADVAAYLGKAEAGLTRHDLCHGSNALRAEGHYTGRDYRAELARLGLPQPATLVGVDVSSEWLRLRAIPTPTAKGA